MVADGVPQLFGFISSRLTDKPSEVLLVEMQSNEGGG